MLFSRKDLAKIILPFILQQVLAVFISTADSVMVSHAGEAAISGVSLVGQLDILLIYAFSSLVSGGAVVVSQAIGKGDRSVACDTAKQLVYSATAIAALVTTLVLIFRRPLLSMLFGDVEADVMSHAQSYFFFIALSFPFLAIESSIAALFRSMGNSFITLLISIMMNLINLCGNAALIIGFGMGAAGAAIATLIARIVGAAVMVVLIRNKKNFVFIERILNYRPDFSTIRSILRIGIPNGIENSMFQFGKLLTQSLISSMGTAAIAANAVANTISGYQYTAGSAFGSTMVTVVGRSIGAGEKKQAKYYARLLVICAYIAIGTVVVFTLLFSDGLIGLFSLSSEAKNIASKLILAHAIAAAVMWPTAFTLPNAFRAASDVRFSMVVSVASMWIFRVALGHVLALDSVSVFGLFTIPGLGMGVMGVWVAMFVDWVFRLILFLWRYLSGRWLTVYRPPNRSRVPEKAESKS